MPSASIMRVGVSTLPFIRRDATDRNRTSPFAFTGNKFEFRMVPSSGCIADANIVLNSIAADALESFADELEKAENFESAMRALVRREMTAHQRIIFNGNGYTDEWVAEADARSAEYRQHGGRHSGAGEAGVRCAVCRRGFIRRRSFSPVRMFPTSCTPRRSISKP